MELTVTHMADRREQTSDNRGLPASYARAVEALRGTCTHCNERATVSSGTGVGLCERHKRERGERDRSGIRAREIARRQIDMARRT